MADPNFFPRSKKLTLEQISKLTKINLPISTDKNRVFLDISSLEEASKDDISFLNNKNYIDQFKKSKAGACFFKKDFINIAPKNTIHLVSENPYHSFAIIANAFYPMKDITAAGVHPKAHVETSVNYDDTVQIAPGAVVSSDVIIGSKCLIGANTVILSGVIIGDNTVIGANCTIAYSIIGSNVKIHNGARIGQDGFGFAQNENINIKMPQLGRVLIKDKVEIGSNCSIDRGTGPDTIIGEGTKLDNLVQIGHNAVLGKNCILVAQSGISGSTHIGNNVIIGGQVGIAGHLKIGNNVRIAAKSGVMKNIKDDMTIGGVPSVPINDWHRQTIVLKKLIKKKK
jgi:UDP-3-O-[3-hydroxymyristoyl] glucosamine N-acyltransferase